MIQLFAVLVLLLLLTIVAGDVNANNKSFWCARCVEKWDRTVDI